MCVWVVMWFSPVRSDWERQRVRKRRQKKRREEHMRMRQEERRERCSRERNIEKTVFHRLCSFCSPPREKENPHDSKWWEGSNTGIIKQKQAIIKKQPALFVCFSVHTHTLMWAKREALLSREENKSRTHIKPLEAGAKHLSHHKRIIS